MQPCPYHAELAEDVKAIRKAVCGDPELGHRGLVNRVQAIEEAQAKSHKRELYQRGWIAGITAIIIAVWQGFMAWLRWNK